VWIEKIEVNRPIADSMANDPRLLPAECRQRHITYSGSAVGLLAWQIDDGRPRRTEIQLGNWPIMVKSSACHLHELNEEQLVQHKEDARELGGYFIINGNERLLRLIIAKRRNTVFAEKKGFFQDKANNFTSYGAFMRCARADNSAVNLRAHYTTEGKVMVSFYHNKIEYFIPAIVLFRCFVDCTDREVYHAVTRGRDTNSFFQSRTEILVRDADNFNCSSKHQALSFIGEKFRIILRLPYELTDAQVGQYLMDQYFFVHCSNDREKSEALAYMIQTLYLVANGEIKPENDDALSAHEALLPGQLFQLVAKGNIERGLALGRYALLMNLEKSIKSSPNSAADLITKLHDESFIRQTFQKSLDIGARMKNLLSTGNCPSNIDVDIPQYSGLAIMAERLNHMRFLAHFRSIHRGAFFTTMRTTSIRKLLPESWGFLCPVHTPDGEPCGLLNHLAAPCDIITHTVQYNRKNLLKTLVEIGMNSLESKVALPSSYLNVVLDGIPVGFVSVKLAPGFIRQLRFLKTSSGNKRADSIPDVLEICPIIDFSDRLAPGIILNTSSCRFIRPVKNLVNREIEWISPREQLFLDIAVVNDDIRKGETTHIELHPTSMLSMLASSTPFSDFNQSPRNMYQCQMAKQSMATPLYNYTYRTENKLYRLQTPQVPIVRNRAQESYDLDDYPMGTNAVVAVISYTGYDMEDAMIINKSAYERGFAHGSMYKTVIEDLSPEIGRAKYQPKRHFGNENDSARKIITPKLDADGFPQIGTRVTRGDPLCCAVEDNNHDFNIVKHKNSEPAYVEAISLVAPDSSKQQKATIRLRHCRNPIIGDKFSSRHGQKGVLSQLWPQIDMPFTAEGLTPDVIINPHAFPSRMTIGMLIESMAGKAGSIEGTFEDATPFQYDENNLAIDEFGKRLIKHGYHYLGNETMYSGVSGEAFEADVYIGVVYYQRLRHMVSDKSQVRSTGGINQLTHQPVHGRKRGGGVRFGEMERDALIGHGASFLLQDRLFNCSDRHSVRIFFLRICF
jgi:DNA-directed RNA polymerase I subunit RPA2